MDRTLAVGLWDPSTAMRRCRADVAAAFGLKPWAIVGPDRFDRLCRARFAVLWVLAARWPTLTRVQLAHLIGVSDHSTVVYGLRRALDLRRTDMVFHAVTEALALARPVPSMPLAGDLLGPVRQEAEIARRMVKPRNDMQEDDADARLRHTGSDALLRALQREHPERFAVAA